MFRTLRARVLLLAFAVQAVAFGLLAYSGHRVLHDQLLAELRSTAETTHHLLNAATAPLFAQMDYGSLQELAAESRESMGLVYLGLYDASGRRVAMAGEVPPSFQDDGAFKADLSSAREDAFRFSGPVKLRDQTYGRMLFGVPAERLRTGERELLTSVAFIGLITLGAALALLAPLVGLATRRVSQLTAATADVGAGDYNIKLDTRGNDETARLAQAFERMSRALAERMHALEEAEARQRALVEGLAEGVVFQDENDKVLTCNDAALRILGLTRPQLLGSDSIDPRWNAIDRDGTPFDWSRHPSVLAQRTGQPQRDVVMGVNRADGSRVWISVNSEPLLRPGEARPYATVTSFSDITARVDAEARLQETNTLLEQRVAERTADLAAARDAAEQASRAKSEFLSRMSHELRTPLNAILGFAQVIQLQYPNVDAGVSEQLRLIEKAGWHLLALINDVLDLSRIEAGGMLVSREPVDLHEVAAEVIRMSEPQAAAMAVQLSLVAAPGVDAALADRTRLRQVLTNLVSNAVKYNRQGGEVTVSLRAERDQVEIEVADTGRGFSPQQVASMYQPFNRLGAEGGTVPGTGIGLLITKRLVELMDGTLALDTQPGAGSRFTVRLPAAAASPARAHETLPLPRSTAATGADAQRLVLYIEDNPSNVSLLAGVIALRPELRMISAPDGFSGLARAQEARPDLIVIDIALPDINGFEVCRRLRADATLGNLPLIALSANAMASDIVLGEQAGFDAYLTKPLDVRTFLAQVDRLLAARRPNEETT